MPLSMVIWGMVYDIVLPTLIVFSNQWQHMGTYGISWINIWTMSLLFIKYGKMIWLANGFDGRVKQCNDEESTGHHPLKQRNTTCFGLEISKTALCSPSDAFLTLWHRTIYNIFFFLRTYFCTYRCSYLFAEVVIAPRTTISCIQHQQSSKCWSVLVPFPTCLETSTVASPEFRKPMEP